VDDLEAELDHLYAVVPGEFVSERDRLARELRTTGDQEEAVRVKALRKPSVSVWTVNQLARRERRQVDLLLDAGHRLREAQSEPKSMEAARRKQRQAMDALGVAARAILAEQGRPSEATVKRVMETLQAAAVSAEGRELLARGRLTGDLEPAGFELLAPVKPASRKAPTGRSARSTKRVEEARRRLREARMLAKAAEKNVRAAEQEAATARGALARSEEGLRRAEAEAAKALAAVERAEKQLRQAQGTTRS
jgi:hypothetical protein